MKQATGGTYRRARTSSAIGRIAAAILGFVVMLTGTITTAAIAQAAVGSVNAIDLVTVYDGAQVPNDFDDSANNGIVASNDVVGFRWELNATDLGDGIFTQTLPEGWTWDPTSLASLDSESSAYHASYTLSEDGRTLTATISIGNGTGNPSVVGFGTLKAVPSSDVPNGSIYTPSLEVTDGAQTQTATTDPIEVRNAPRADIVKTRAANNVLGTFDFGDGPVAARYIDFPITVANAAGKIGARNVQLQQPFVVTDSFELQAPAGFGDAQFVAQIVSQSEPGATVDLVQQGNDLTLTFDGFTRVPTASTTVRLWVRDAEVPTDSVGATTVKNTVAAQNWVDTDGDPVAEEPSGNTAQGTVMKPPTFGNIDRQKRIYLYNDQEGSTSLSGDPARSGQPFTNVSGKEISLGSKVVSWFAMRPAVESSTGLATAANELVAYDFWDPSEQRLIDGADIYVGANNSAATLASADYTIEYTTGTNSVNAEDNSWVTSVAAAGGADQISGIRIAYTAGPWAANTAANSAYFTVAVPFVITAPLGTSADDRAETRFIDHAGEPRATSVTQFVNVGSYRLGLDKTASRSSIVSGADIAYTLQPSTARALGAIADVDVRDLVVVDQLPAGLVSVNTDGVDPAWQVSRSGSAASGLQLTFTYTGTTRTGEPLPAIEYRVTTSVQAPVSRTLVNTATVTALGTTQPVSARTDATTTSIVQAEVITEEKVVVGEEQIEVGDPQVSWESRWFNFQTSSQGESFFVDVLPYSGDARGSSFAGTASLASAVITNGAGEPASSGYGSLQYTTADAAEVYAAEANDASITWVDADDLDLTAIDGITALRVIVHDFASGAAGTGGLLVTMDVDGQLAGDQYVNTINGWLGASGKLGRSNPAAVDVVASSISGVVWEDLNADGVRDVGEPLIGNAPVRLLDVSGAEIGSARTAADGSYAFPQLHSGEYRVVVNSTPTALGFSAHYVVTNTYDLDGNLDSDSGTIALGKSEVRELVDFGYVTRVSDIDLVKSGKLAGEGRAGEWVDWSFIITNSGENPLTSVDLADHLAGVTDLIVQWPGAEGVLDAGQSAPATARYQLTQADVDAGFVHNTATATGLDPNGTPVDDPAEATVTLPEGGSLMLQKSGSLTGDAVVGGQIDWTFTVTNTGNVTLDAVDLNDELAGLGEIVWGEWPGAEFTLEPGQSISASAPYALTQADLDAGCIENVASATALTPGDRPVMSADDATVCMSPSSAISVVKRTNGEVYDDAPGALLHVGDRVIWTYELTNTGATTLRDITLVDDQEGVIAAPDGFDGVLAPGESVTFSAEGRASSGQYHNVAVVTGTTPGGGSVTDSDESWYRASDRAGLALTGGQLWGAGLIGLLLVGGGAVLWVLRRRAS